MKKQEQNKHKAPRRTSESLSNLDKTIKITSPVSWLALLGVTIIIAAVVYWSIYGWLPATLTVEGVIANAAAAENTYYAECDGTVRFNKVKVGTYVQPGSYIGENDQDTPMSIIGENKNTPCYSNLWGYVSELMVEDGVPVKEGMPLLRVRPNVSETHVVVCYVPLAHIGKLEAGQTEAIITPSLNDGNANTYGNMYGQVLNIDRWPTQQSNTISSLFSSFKADGQMCAVTIRLAPNNTDHPNAKNEYWWSNEKGYTLPIQSPMQCSVKLVINKVHPIEKLFAKLREILGD